MMPLDPNSLPPRVKSDPLIGLLLEQKLPLTKANYLRAMLADEPPEFPLDAEIESAVPKELDGDLPTDLTGFYRGQ